MSSRYLCFFIACICVLVSSCGLPQLVFLAPLTSVSIADRTPPVINFSHDTINNNDNFRGYSLYYKFYDQVANAGGCRSDRDVITQIPPVLNPSRLQQRGYRQILFIDDNNTALDIISIPNKGIASRFSVTIPTPTNLDNVATMQIDTLTYRIYRNIPNTSDIGSISNQCSPDPSVSSPCKPFDIDNRSVLSAVFNSSDADLRNITDPPAVFNRNELYVAFYGIARGIDINNSFQPIYSEPRFLGYISMSATASPGSQQCNDGLQ